MISSEHLLMYPEDYMAFEMRSERNELIEGFSIDFSITLNDAKKMAEVMAKAYLKHHRDEYANAKHAWEYMNLGINAAYIILDMRDEYFPIWEQIQESYREE